MAHRPDQLLDHEADGIREFDNQLPRWWLYGFYFTILFAAAYLVNYHVLPTPLVGKKGMIAEYEAELEAAAATAAARPAPAAPVALAAATDEATLRRGEAIFNSQTSLCSSCHRPDLGGLVGPNLTDDYWLHGCSVSDIVSSIRTGYPTMGMLPYGSNTPLSDDELLAVASYILSKRGSNPENPKPRDPERDVLCN
ncbi:MAG TPA: cbb3-type cytochrome c oxidase N-terminal domain-containing protein [Vicinamibacterales bacterium]